MFLRLSKAEYLRQQQRRIAELRSRLESILQTVSLDTGDLFRKLEALRQTEGILDESPYDSSIVLSIGPWNGTAREIVK